MLWTLLFLAGFLIAGWLLFINLQQSQQTREDLRECRSTVEFYQTVGLPTPLSAGQAAQNAQEQGVTLTYTLDAATVQRALQQQQDQREQESPIESFQDSIGTLRSMFQSVTGGGGK